MIGRMNLEEPMTETKEKKAELSGKSQLAQAHAKREAESTKYRTILIALSAGVLIGLFMRR
jgi:hypothetical protein